jgi:nucleotide-binding universal stress UspA family protein
MSTTALLVIATFAIAVLAFFVYISLREVKVSPPTVKPLRGLLPLDEHPPDLDRPPARGLRILAATDGSPCADLAVQSIAMRPWPVGSQVKILTVLHTAVPDLLEPLLMIEAAHHESLEAERARAPIRLQRAERCLAGTPGVTVTSEVLEGKPEDVLLAEAERWPADLIVVGSHGRRPVARLFLGSVSEAVARHAPCSVEIVRCHEAIQK